MICGVRSIDVICGVRLGIGGVRNTEAAAGEDKSYHPYRDHLERSVSINLCTAFFSTFFYSFFLIFGTFYLSL